MTALKNKIIQPMKFALRTLRKQQGVNSYDYVTPYEDHVTKLSLQHNEAEAMALSVGGAFEIVGALEMVALQKFGLKPKDYVIDVGCGSGRLAQRLSTIPKIKYLGTDVVQRLLDYASKICKRDDFTFKRVVELKIPEKDSSADFVCFFSVITHLMSEQAYCYLLEAKRVLKPGGKIILSFLEHGTELGGKVFSANMETVRAGGRPPHIDTFLHADDLKVWAKKLDMQVVQIVSGDTPFLELKKGQFEKTLPPGKHALGQSLCVLKKKA